jgi:hypothetical protein
MLRLERGTLMFLVPAWLGVVLVKVTTPRQRVWWW